MVTLAPIIPFICSFVKLQSLKLSMQPTKWHGSVALNQLPWRRLLIAITRLFMHCHPQSLPSFLHSFFPSSLLLSFEPFLPSFYPSHLFLPFLPSLQLPTFLPIILHAFPSFLPSFLHSFLPSLFPLFPSLTDKVHLVLF